MGFGILPAPSRHQSQGTEGVHTQNAKAKSDFHDLHVLLSTVSNHTSVAIEVARNVETGKLSRTHGGTTRPSLSKLSRSFRRILRNRCHKAKPQFVSFSGDFTRLRRHGPFISCHVLLPPSFSLLGCPVGV